MPAETHFAAALLIRVISMGDKESVTPDERVDAAIGSYGDVMVSGI
jgi:hypothetical protein